MPSLVYSYNVGIKGAARKMGGGGLQSAVGMTHVFWESLVMGYANY